MKTNIKTIKKATIKSNLEIALTPTDLWKANNSSVQKFQPNLLTVYILTTLSWACFKQKHLWFTTFLAFYHSKRRLRLAPSPTQTEPSGHPRERPPTPNPLAWLGASRRYRYGRVDKNRKFVFFCPSLVNSLGLSRCFFF